MRPPRWLLTALFISLCTSLFAQTSRQTDRQERISNYAVRYLNAAESQASLFLGRVQPPVYRSLESLYVTERYKKILDEWGDEKKPVPLPPSETYGEGTVYYDGILYPGVFLRLDLYRDEMVVRTSTGVYGLVLDPAKFGWAEYFGYRVVFVPAGSPEYRLPEGYYLELLSGEHRILKKETFQFNPSEMQFVNRSIRYYIEKNGAFHRVKNSKGSVLKMFREHRRELDRFIRQNGLNVKKDMENAVVQIVSEYERINRGGL